jgi:ankyrin repeat protein
MTQATLPERPNLAFLKKLAKKRLRTMRASAATAGAKLADAQLAVARDYGFASWRKLHAHVIATPPPKHMDAFDPQLTAQAAVRAMERAWAESLAIIERRFDDAADGPRWEATGVESPTLTEREADAAIIRRRQMGQYRMISIWHASPAAAKSFRPTRSLEFLQDGDLSTPITGGTWRRIDWLPSKPTFPGRPGRPDDIAEALAFLHESAPTGDYRVITVRRMLRAEQAAGRVKIVKKHFSGRVEPAPAPDDLFVAALPDHRKTHKIAQWKPLMDAAFDGNVERAQKLLDVGADANCISTTPHRYRPLHRAIELKKTRPRGPEHERVVKLLLERGADPKLRGTFTQLTALQLAAQGETRFVPMLLPLFQPLDIFHAAAIGDDKRVAALLKHDASLAVALDENGWTPLHYCCASAMFKSSPAATDALVRVAKMLLERGADPTASFLFEGKWPMRPLYHCCGQHDNPAVAEVLFRAGATPFDDETVYHAADEQHIECLALIEKYADPQKLAAEASKNLAVQLHWGHTCGARWLLEHGADPNRIESRLGNSALHEAVIRRASDATLKLLLKHDGDPRQKNREGLSAIQLARRSDMRGPNRPCPTGRDGTPGSALKTKSAARILAILQQPPWSKSNPSTKAKKGVRR